MVPHGHPKDLHFPISFHLSRLLFGAKSDPDHVDLRNAVLSLLFYTCCNNSTICFLM